MKRRREVIVVLMGIWLLTVLSACGKNDSWLFSINGEKLDNKDVTVFGLIYTMEYNIISQEQLIEEYERGKSYEEFYKDDLEEEIIDTMLLYAAAKENKTKLTENDKRLAEEQTISLMDAFGQEWLDSKDLSRSDVQKIFEMKQLGTAYARSAAVQESDVQEGKTDAERYIRVYQVTFPIVELDEMGMVCSDQNGELILLPEEEAEQRKEAAEEFADKIRAGAEIDLLLKEYDAAVIGIEKRLKYNDLEKDYRQAVDRMKEGETSDVISSAYGYYVVQLLDSNDMDYSEAISFHEEETQKEKLLQEEYDRLYHNYIGNDQNYMNRELWKEIKMIDYIK